MRLSLGVRSILANEAVSKKILKAGKLGLGSLSPFKSRKKILDLRKRSFLLAKRASKEFRNSNRNLMKIHRRRINRRTKPAFEWKYGFQGVPKKHIRRFNRREGWEYVKSVRRFYRSAKKHLKK